jgi:hypothetical protein
MENKMENTIANNNVKNRKNNITLIGGENLLQQQNIQLQTYYAIIILGYFGVKIVYGLFFQFYPEKYYHKNIYVTTNELSDPDNPNQSMTNDIIMNAFVPGLWNSEIIDFVTLVVFTYIIYVFTNVSSKSYINKFGNPNFVFILGYILGLGFPPIYSNYIKLYADQVQQSPAFQYIYLIFCAAFIVFVISMNYISLNKMETVHKVNYTVYILVIALVIFGLVVSKKNLNSYSSFTQFYAKDEKCSFSKNGVYQTSGDVIKFTAPFLVFIILLLFSYEPRELSMKNLYIFIYGLLMGVFVSSVSYFGIEYFLEKRPIKECSSVGECKYKDMPLPLVEKVIHEEEHKSPHLSNFNKNIKSNIENNIKKTFNSNAILKIIIVVLIVVLGLYLIYYYIGKGFIEKRLASSS